MSLYQPHKTKLFKFLKQYKVTTNEDKKTHVVDARVIMPAQITIDEKLYGHKQKFKFSFSWVLLAKSADEAKTIASKFENGCVVKSQILGGGRGMGHIKETGF